MVDEHGAPPDSFPRDEGRFVFGSVAEGYTGARPDDPDRVYDILRDRCGLAPASRVLEIGAGTGQATRRLVDAGAFVVAVEPAPTAETRGGDVTDSRKAGILPGAAPHSTSDDVRNRMTDPAHPSITDALQDWRVAERAAAVARRGTVAAETAAAAAADAAEAAIATAEAARSALAAVTLAEESAMKTAGAAKLAAMSTRADAVDAGAFAALADVDEVDAQARYQSASNNRG